VIAYRCPNCGGLERQRLYLYNIFPSLGLFLLDKWRAYIFEQPHFSLTLICKCEGKENENQ